MRQGEKPRKSKAETRRSVGRKSPKNDASGRRDLEQRLAESLAREKATSELLQEKDRALTEALEQQTATAEILRVISRSQTDVQPVFDTIISSAVRLCDGLFGALYQFDGELIHLVAQHNVTPEALEEAHRIYPARPTRAFGAGRAILERAVVHMPDVERDPEFQHQTVARAVGFRSALSVPMLREGAPIGVIAVTRAEPGPFSDNQIELLKTFADQAVIAVENVRLLKELEVRNRDLTEALEQQTATSEILRVISSSPTDVQPVFDTIVRSAVRLCDGLFSALNRFDGELIHPVARHNYTPEALEEQHRIFPARPTRGLGVGRAILERAVVHIPDVELDPEYQQPALSRAIGFRSGLWVPMLREGTPIGVIGVARAEPGPFSDNEIELLKTFADQAVIAVENVRLFTELRASNRELTTALDQQTATSGILRVISQSQTDVQPVFDAIVSSAVRLLGAYGSVLTRLADEAIILAAFTSTGEAGDAAIRAQFPESLRSRGAHATIIRDRVQINSADAPNDPRLLEATRNAARARGFRSLVGVPLLHHEEAIGAITVSRREPGGFTDDEIALLQTFADQAVIAIENVRLFKELEARNGDLTEALDQQTATAEVLKVISRSTFDLAPVLETLIENATKLCDATHGVIYRFDGEVFRVGAYYGASAEARDFLQRQGELRPGRGSIVGRLALEHGTVHIHDLLADPEYQQSEARRVARIRTIMGVPMLREGVLIGAIVIWRTEVRTFAEKQIELVTTFADQAVIAIENVRLFKELEARNRDLTATGEILRVISSSPTNEQPVFEAIVESARRLCEAAFSIVVLIEGEQQILVAFRGLDEAGTAAVQGVYPRPIARDTTSGRAILDRSVVHISDTKLDPTYTHPLRNTISLRSILTVPFFRDGRPFGALSVWRSEPKPFTDEQIALLKTFGDQAVIAIENVRLFKELEARNTDLTESLEQQTATAEILRVISRSQTDVQPVFDTIVRSAVGLCGGLFSALYQFDGELIHSVAQHNFTPEALAEAHRVFPARPTRALYSGRAILERAIVHVPDSEVDPEHQHRTLRRAIGWRSGLFVPMLREGSPIGVIEVARAEPGPFSNSEIELLKTFADQAVIAIENVRLFKELQARTSELTQSVEQLTALGEVSQALSSTLDLDTVLTTIVSRAVQLSGANGGSIFEYDELAEEFLPRASNEVEDVIAATQQTRLRKGEGAVGRMAVTRETVQIPDIAIEGAYESRARAALLRSGRHALLAVPLLSEQHIVGGLVISRNAAGAFPGEVVELLKTFATQSALAIQNARLFREIADKSAQLEAASRHKSEFLANMSHELRTPLNAIIGFSEILAEKMFGDVNEKQTEYLQDILESGRHLLSLINDILDLSKIEAGRMELELGKFDLPQAIENALILVRERANRRGIRLGSTIDPRVGTIGGDERKVKQVLLNLLSNALKFTPEGGRIDVSARLDNDMAEVSVADTGIGIAPADQEAVFEEFRQVGTADKKAEGTGLGLALSRKFIELHGGRIWVKSQVGQGSTFAFTLPLGR